jgi:hypothetical protein
MAMKFRKILIRVSVVLLAVITAVLLLRAVFTFTTGKKLEDFLAKAKAEGNALKVKDLVPDCPDSDNAAVLWKASEVLFSLDAKARELLSKTVQDLFYERPIDDESRTKLTRYIEQNRRALDLVIEAAALSCFRYGDWSQPGYDVNFPNGVKLILATRLLAVDAVLRADRGQIREALNECLSGMRLMRMIVDEPFNITAHISLANMKILLISLNRIASGRELDSETLNAWMKELDPPSWRSRFVRCLPGESALSIEIRLDMIKGQPEAVNSFFGTTSASNRLLSWLIRPLLKSDILWFHAAYNDLEKIALLPYYQQREFFSRQNQKSGSSPWYYRIVRTHISLSDYHSAFLKEATLEAMMLATRTGLACKIHKQKNGRYPENLAALVSGLLDTEPIDPFTGRPLAYRIQEGELLIYSFGSNEKDDGGRGTYLFDRLVMEKDDDWSWREKIR